MHSPLSLSLSLPAGFGGFPLLSYGFTTHFLPEGQETIQRDVLVSDSEGFCIRGGVDAEKSGKGMTQ